MKNPWFRLYSEFAADPKVQSMSETFQRRLIMLFCLRCSGDLPGLSDTEIGCALRIPPSEIVKTKQTFLVKGFIDDFWQIVNWDKRQFLSDDVTKRVQRFREKNNPKRNVSETLQKRSCNENETVPDTDTDTDTKEKSKKHTACDHAAGNGVEPIITKRKRKLAGKRLEAFMEFWNAFAFKKGKAAAADAWLEIEQFTYDLVPKIVNAAKIEARSRVNIISEGRTPKWPEGWLSARRWEDENIGTQTSRYFG